MNLKKRFADNLFFISFSFYLPVILWCLGFLFGAVIGRFAEPAAVFWMLRAFLTPMSIDGLLASYYLPLLLWIVLAQTKHTTLICICCFMNAFVLSYLMRCLVFSIPYWWPLLLMLFCPAFCNGILLLWLSFRSRMEAKELPYLLPVVLTSVIAALDYFVFSPFVSSVTM